jgi:hypothetical protein
MAKVGKNLTFGKEVGKGPVPNLHTLAIFL